MTASRVADYFFVAGVHDTHILPTYQQVKKQGGENLPNDSQYYQQQEQAVNGGIPQFMPLEEQKDSSLLGVLDHVQNVIDHFDKERDTARDNVIAVHGKRSESERTMTLLRRSDTRKWRSPSDPKMLIKQTKDVPNLMEVKYTPTILMRYPQRNYSADESFPPYAAMFCFPRDIHLYYGKHPPSEQLHSFTMTDENGATVYGTCIVFYEKLPYHLVEPIDQCLKDWKDVSLHNRIC
ncbi:hypothetical protein K501DRAFT_745 [Backusella circina FSU 941]|nr:hypothetical protein K501DRAFT_745 [Backusella circina FSU 941]